MDVTKPTAQPKPSTLMGSRPCTKQRCSFTISPPLAQTYRTVTVLCWWMPGAKGRFQWRQEDRKGILKCADKSAGKHSDSPTLAGTGALNTMSRASSQLLSSSLDALTRSFLSGLGSSDNNMCFSSSCCFSAPPLNTKPASQLQEPRAGQRQTGGRSVQVTEERKNISPHPSPTQVPWLAFHLWHSLVNASQIVTPSPFMLSQRKERSHNSYTRKNLISWALLPSLPSSLCFENS